MYSDFNDTGLAVGWPLIANVFWGERSFALDVVRCNPSHFESSRCFFNVYCLFVSVCE